MRLKILLTNDDGIFAPGIAALCKAVGTRHDVYVVAPDSNRSACGHSITMSVPILHKEAKLEGSAAAYSLNGTPADCVKYSVLELFGGKPAGWFDLVLSGINAGPNLGSDVMYSGTVSAAFEGAYLGIKGIAVSYYDWTAKQVSDFAAAAKFAADNLELLAGLVQPDGIININYPVNPKGYKFTKIGINLYDDCYEPRDCGGKQLWGQPTKHNRNPADCDVEWIKKGYITISPATLDKNDYGTLERLQKEGIKCVL